MGSFSICCYIIYANFSWVLPVMSSHSGDVNMKRPSMMFLSITICFRCQKGGQPTSLDSTVSHLSSLRKMHKNQRWILQCEHDDAARPPMTNKSHYNRCWPPGRQEASYLRVHFFSISFRVFEHVTF